MRSSEGIAPLAPSRAGAGPRWVPLAIAGNAALMAALTLGQLRLGAPPGADLDTVRLLAATLAYVAANAAFTGGAIACSVRWPVWGARWPRHLALHAGAAVAMSGVESLGLAAERAIAGWGGQPLEAGGVLAHVVGYGLVAAIAHAVLLWRRIARARAARERLVRAVVREGRARVGAELRALKAELHPAVVGSALRTARELAPTDPEASERLLVQLGARMREAVVAASVDEVPLTEEIAAATEGGLAIAEVAPGLEDLVVPHLLVPALLACIGAGDAAAGPATLRMRPHGGDRPGASGGPPGLELVVLAGIPPVGTPAERAAAERALRRRLGRMYGAAAALLVGTTADGRRLARATLPARTDAAPAVAVAAVGAVRPERDRRTRPLPDRASGAAPVGAPSAEERLLRRWMIGEAEDRRGGWLDAAFVAAFWLSSAGWRIAGTIRAEGLPRSAAEWWRADGTGWVLLALAVVAVAVTRRWPLGGVPVRRAVAAQLGWGGAAVAAAAAGSAALELLAGEPGTAALDLEREAWRTLWLAVAQGILVALAHAGLLVDARRRAGRIARALRRARAEEVRARTAHELRALKAELHPHFVGNALHTAAALVARDPAAAARMLGALERLAADAAGRAAVQEVPLADELADLAPYLALERTRLAVAGGELEVAWAVEPTVRDALVPHLVLQPLAENAVRHGLAPRLATGGGNGKGRLVIGAERHDDALVLWVADDGVGVQGALAGAPAGAPAGASAARRGAGAGGLDTGAGLGGVRRRLALLHGAAASCALEPAPGGGTVARVVVPYRVARAAVHHATVPAVAGG